ncbi:hypothetical protein M9458_045585, partial [Cirrhinus mrigala]
AAQANISRTSGSPAEAQSEALVHVAKKPKISVDDELEDGELRSEEEDESTEDEDAVNDNTEKKIPVMHHNDDEDETDDDDDSDKEELQENKSLEVEMKDCPPHNNVQDAQVDDGNQNKVIPVNITSKIEEDMTVSQDPEEAHNTDDGKIQCEDSKLDVSPPTRQENISSHAGLPEVDGVQHKTGDGEEELQENKSLEVEMKDCPPQNSVQDAQADDGNQNKVNISRKIEEIMVSQDHEAETLTDDGRSQCKDNKFDVSPHKVDLVNINSKTEETVVSQDPEEAHNTETFTDDGRIQCEDNKFDISPHECQKNINSHAGLTEDDGVQHKTGDGEEDLQGNENLKVEMKDCPPHNSVEDAQVDDGNQNKVDLVNINSKTEETMVSQDPEEAHNTETFTDDGRIQCEDSKLDVSPHECQENINSNAGLPEVDGVQDKTGDGEDLQGNENLEVEMKDCPPHNSVEDAQVDDGNQNKVVPVNINSKTEELMTVSQDHEAETCTDDGRIQCEDNKLDVLSHGCQENINSNAGLPEDDGVQDKNAESDANHDQEGKFIMSSSCERSDMSQIEGQEKILEENTNVYLNE